MLSSNLTNNTLNNTLKNDNANLISYSDTLWLMTSSALVFLMVPGLGFYYSGYVKRLSSLTILFSVLLPFSLVTLQWFIIGYSLVFSDKGSKIIGNFDHVLINNVGSNPNSIVTTVPSNIFMIYQGLFASITPCVFFGSVAERGTLSSFVLICVFWSTFVYDFIAYWTWNKNGWLNRLGALDFAGGGPVHIASGFAGFAYALAVGPRKNVDFKNLKPVNLTEVFLGTCLLWIGWLGFNGGSEGSINSRAVNAVLASNLAASSCGISWVLIEMIVNRTKNISLNAFCTGAIAGLVAITPGCGFVKPIFSILIGIIASIVCYAGTYLKKATKYKFDDTVDVFAIHGIGGMIGSLMTGVFAQNSIATMANASSSIPGGVIDGNYMQIVYQLLAIVVAAIWSFMITFTFAKLIDFIPFLKLRLNEKEQELGQDFVELGELTHDCLAKQTTEVEIFTLTQTTNNRKCKIQPKDIDEIK